MAAAIIKLVTKGISSLTKKKKKKSSVPSGKKKSSTKEKESKSTAGPFKKVIERKTEGKTVGGKKVKVMPTSKKEKSAPKKIATKAKKEASKKAMSSVKKKADKKIAGTGSQAGRKKVADRPKGGTTGISMGAARKKQMRDTANLSTKKNKQGVSLAMKRAYEDTGKYKTTLLAALRSGDRDRIRRAFARVDISVPDFLAVHRQFRGGI